MRPAPLLVLLAGLLLASSARGGVLTSATWTQTIEGAAFGGSWTPSQQYGVSFLASGATAIAGDLDFGLSAEVFAAKETSCSIASSG